jgi:serine/threonine-protein kinase
MDHSEAASAASACPPRDTLLAFLLGKLPDAGLENLAGHLATCAQCNSTLDELQQHHEPDSLLEGLRQCGRVQPLPEESGCTRLEEAARNIPLFSSSLAAATLNDADAACGADTAVIAVARLPTTIGTYDVLDLLGEGGMGVVYKARQQPLGRLVALKMISSGRHAGRRARARFATEGLAIARLQHANVVQIYEFSNHEGVPFYSMELLEGGSLATRLKRGPLPPRQAAELVKTLAAAVEYAHQMNVLHRDLKPANILLTATGAPKIADFGLAKLLDSDDGQTRSDIVVGTPSYMAPEQAGGRHGQIGPATDVYALGAILFQVLTGMPPFQAESKMETVRQVLDTPPPAPRSRQPAVPPVLEAITLKCLQKDPARRYPSAQALADDLGCWLQGAPTVARPPRWPAWLGRWLRRVALVLAVLGGVTATVAAVQYWRDPQRVVEKYERSFSRGESVELLDSTGTPHWSRWSIGQDRSGINTTNGSLTLTSSGPSTLFELLPNAPAGSYRLTAKVQHLSSTVDLAALGCGLFFARTPCAPPYEHVQFCSVLYFNDVVTHPSKNLVQLRTRYLIEGGPVGFMDQQLADKGGVEFQAARGRLAPRIPFWHKHLPLQAVAASAAGLMSFPQGDGPFFLAATAIFAAPPLEIVPQPLTPMPWHDLEVTVTPRCYRASWDGRPLQEMTEPWFVQFAAWQLASRRQMLPHAAHVLPEAPAALPTRGGLGLYVSHGSAAFREVVVTPLPEEP